MTSQRERAPAWPSALAAGLLVLGACGPRLHVESAKLEPLGPEMGNAARLQFTATYSGFDLDPRRPVRIHVGDDVRWVMLHPVQGTSDVWALEAPDQNYRFQVDVGRQRVEATEPTWPPRTDG